MPRDLLYQWARTSASFAQKMERKKIFFLAAGGRRSRAERLRGGGERSRERLYTATASGTATATATAMSMDFNIDIQRKLAEFVYADQLSPRIDKGSVISEDEPPGEVIASIRQDKFLSKFPLVCKTWREELQKYRKQEIDALIAQFIALSPPQALELVNISNYPEETWEAQPEVSILNFDIFLGSRLQLAISLMRRRIKGTAEQELIVQICVAERTDGPWLSPELCVVPHALCSVSGWNFADDDNLTYDTWYLATTELIKTFLADQYAALSAPI